MANQKHAENRRCDVVRMLHEYRKGLQESDGTTGETRLAAHRMSRGNHDDLSQPGAPVEKIPTLFVGTGTTS